MVALGDKHLMPFRVWLRLIASCTMGAVLLMTAKLSTEQQPYFSFYGLGGLSVIGKNTYT